MASTARSTSRARAAAADARHADRPGRDRPPGRHRRAAGHPPAGLETREAAEALHGPPAPGRAGARARRSSPASGGRTSSRACASPTATARSAPCGGCSSSPASRCSRSNGRRHRAARPDGRRRRPRARHGRAAASTSTSSSSGSASAAAATIRDPTSRPGRPSRPTARLASATWARLRFRSARRPAGRRLTARPSGAPLHRAQRALAEQRAQTQLGRGPRIEDERQLQRPHRPQRRHPHAQPATQEGAQLHSRRAPSALCRSGQRRPVPPPPAAATTRPAGTASRCCRA